MDRDLKQVLTVFAVVISFGGGYFLNQWQNSEKIELGEKFLIMNKIEDEIKDMRNPDISYGQDSIDEAVSAYYGSKDKYFAYVSDSEDDEEIDFSALSGEIESEYQMVENVCVIKCCRFYMLESAVFTEAYEEYNDECDSYIIDLRDNSGGETSTAVNVLGNFLGEKDICKMHYYNGETKTHKSDNTKCFDKPVVILVNESTASASEIFTASMIKNYEDVTVIGTNTTGKGTFQSSARIKGEGSLKFTAGYYTVGDWECYQDIGIAPDIEVEMDSELIGTDEDIQLQAAIDYLNGGQID